MMRYQRHVSVGRTLERQIVAVFDDGTVQRTTYVQTPDQPWWRFDRSWETHPAPIELAELQRQLLLDCYVLQSIEKEAA